MTREEAIKEYVIPALKHTWNEKINKKVLEALEQEPVIDKIRAEIDGLKKDSLISWASSEMIISTILNIIDKYKAESEEV